MSITNIFMGRYEQRENQLTYCFLSLLEKITPTRSAALLAPAVKGSDNPRSIAVSTLYGGSGGNPDGSVSLDYPSGTFEVFLEVKTSRREAEADQISRHLRHRVGGSVDKSLLLIAANPRDKECLAALQRKEAQQVHFVTWRELADRCCKLASDDRDSKDGFLLEEFAEYLAKEPLTGVAGMIQRDDLEAVARLNELGLREKETDFKNKTFELMTEFKEKLCPLFERIADAEVSQVEGAWIYVDCSLRDSPNRVGFGVYYREDPNLPFQEKYQPEFAVWVHIIREARVQLDGDDKLLEAAQALMQKDYRVNLPARRGTQWLLCHWSEPMRHFVENDLDRDRIQVKFEERLRVLFDSAFLNRAIELTR